METVKVWNVWYVDSYSEMQHCAIKADHFSIPGEETLVFYTDGKETEEVAIFTSVVFCTLEGVVVK